MQNIYIHIGKENKNVIKPLSNPAILHNDTSIKIPLMCNQAILTKNYDL